MGQGALVSIAKSLKFQMRTLLFAPCSASALGCSPARAALHLWLPELHPPCSSWDPGDTEGECRVLQLSA